MSKSIKFRNNVYLDSTSVVHGRNSLNQFLNGTLACRNLGVYASDLAFDLNDLKPGESICWSTTHAFKNVPCNGRKMLVSFSVWKCFISNCYIL